MSSKRAKRRKECERKSRYTEYGAHKRAAALAHATGQRISAYRCKWCGGWHVGHTPYRVRQSMRDRRKWGRS